MSNPNVSYLEQALDAADSCIFTGDALESEDGRRMLREHIARWQRALVERGPQKPIVVEIECHTGTDVPCAIGRSTVLPRVLSCHGGGLSVKRALDNMHEVLIAVEPHKHVGWDAVLSDYHDLVGAVK